MALTKKDSSDSVEWSSITASGPYLSNPDCGVGGYEMPVANMYFEGCEIEVKQTDEFGNPVEQVNCIPGDMAFSGCAISVSSSTRKIPLTPGNMNFEGCSLTPCHYVENTPGNIDFEGETLTPGHGVVNTPGNIDFEGLSFPVLQGLSVSIPVTPGDIAFQGCSLNIFNFLAAIYTVSVTNTPGNMNFEGVELIPAHGVENTPGDLALEGVLIVPGHGVVNTPGNMDFEGVELRPMWTAPESVQKIKFYTCTLTGSGDGTTDIVLPVSSITIRLRDGDPTYCGVVVPNVDDNEDYINDRPNGQIVINRGYEYTDGSQSIAEICRVDLEDVAYDKGINKSSFQISGHITESNGAPTTFDIRPIQTLSMQSNGARRVRSQPKFFLRSGDTVIYGDSGESFTAGLITISVNINIDRMEVTEYIP